jgi:predicted metalloendopeptidase
MFFFYFGVKGFDVGALIISKIFNEKNKEKLEHIVEEIRLAFIETLPNIEWMDFETRQQAKIKAKMIIGIVNKLF